MAQGMAAATLDELISLPLKWGERKTHCISSCCVWVFSRSIGTLKKEFESSPSCFFILTNSRALGTDEVGELDCWVWYFSLQRVLLFLIFLYFCCLLHWMVSDNMEPCEEYMCKTWIELWVVEIELDGTKIKFYDFCCVGLGRCVDQRNLQECCWGCRQCGLHNSSTWWFNSARPLSSGKTDIPPLLVILCCKS
jgi:hypothetical protein